MAQVVATGIYDVDRKLRQLKLSMAKKIVRRGLRAGAKVVLAEAKRRAPVDEGDLKRSLKVKAGKRSRKGFRYIVQTADGAFKGDQFYAAFVELGTKKMPAKPFMRPAAKAKRAAAQKVAIELIKKDLEAEIKRLRTSKT